MGEKLKFGTRKIKINNVAVDAIVVVMDTLAHSQRISSRSI
jgi:hypothetical protein